jgi:hypothetical protein
VARPERPLDPALGPLQGFAAELRGLREQAGNPKYLQMQRLSGRSRTALAEAAGGDHLPTWETTAGFVRACGGDPDKWRPKWEQVQERVRAHSGSSARLPPGGTGIPAQTSAGPPLQMITTSAAQPGSHADIWLQMWQDQRTQARQSENQRAVATGLVVALSVAAYGYIAFHHNPPLLSALIATVICALGLFGALAAAKYYERFVMHMDCAQAIRSRLDDLFPDLHLVEDWTKNRVRHKRKFAVLYQIRIHHLWVGLTLGLAVSGATLAIAFLTR